MKCSFCGKDIEKGTGTILAKNSGKILYFCSTKCDKNMIKLGRKPRLIQWTTEHVKGGKEAESK
jgi:large subunit ribosomal protein L24e